MAYGKKKKPKNKVKMNGLPKRRKKK